MTDDDDISFDLVERRWILVEAVDGREEEVSLRELFARAGELRRLRGELPTMSFSLLRLALTVLYAATNGPLNDSQWRTLWENPQLPVTDVDAYFARPEVRERFDLLHQRTPFAQVADLHTSKHEVFGLDRLIGDVPTGEPYFTGRSGAAIQRVGFAEAARWLLHVQTFDVSGIKSGAVGDPRVKNGKGYPIGVGHCGALGGVFAEGENLRETLLLNLIPLDRFAEVRLPEYDWPMWERPAHTACEEPSPDVDDPPARPYGPIDLYTWQSRRVRLYGDAAGITGVLVANGDKLDAANLHRVEPMTAWRRSENQQRQRKQPVVYMPFGHDPARSLWRGLEALLPKKTYGSGKEAAKTRAPALVDWLHEAADRGLLDPQKTIRFRAVGMTYGTQNAFVEELVDDAVRFAPAVLLDSADRPLRQTVLDAVAVADDAAKAVARLDADLAKAAGADRDYIAGSARPKAREAAYAALEPKFRAWLAGLGPESDSAAQSERWQQEAHRVLSRLADELVDAAGPAAWAGRDVDGQLVDAPLARLWFVRKLRQILPAGVPKTQPEPSDDQKRVAT